MNDEVDWFTKDFVYPATDAVTRMDILAQRMVPVKKKKKLTKFEAQAREVLTKPIPITPSILTRAIIGLYDLFRR